MVTHRTTRRTTPDTPAPAAPEQAPSTDVAPDGAPAASVGGSPMPSAPVEVVMVDPATLLVDVNVRLDAQRDARADADLLASVRDLGVLVPIVAVSTPEGGLRVRFGHRRTAAAVAAGLVQVPVVVAGDDTGDGDAAGEVARLLGQWAENEHRAALTTAERVGVVAQLAAFGVSPAQIAKRTRLPRRDVDAALTVAGDDLASAATARYDFLDLVQASVVADFSDDPDAVKALVAAAKTGQFDHVAQRLRDTRAETRAREAAASVLRETGVRVIDRPDYASKTTRVANLANDPDGTPQPTALTAEAHAGCPGHAAYLVETWVRADPAPTETDTTQADEEPGGGDAADETPDGETDVDGEDDADDSDNEEDEEDEEDEGGRWEWAPVYVCTDPQANGHRGLYATAPAGKRGVEDLTDAQREAARAERRDVIESNKAWTSAETVRRDWLRAFLTRKTPPKGAAVFVAVGLAHDAHLAADAAASHLAADLLGLPTSTRYGRHARLADTAAAATEARASVVTLAQVLAGYEARMDKTAWRHPRPDITRYLTFLADHGYTLAPVEERARSTQQ